MTRVVRDAGARRAAGLVPVWKWRLTDAAGDVLAVLLRLGLTPIATLPGGLPGAEVPLWSPTLGFATFMDLVASNAAGTTTVVVELKRNCGGGGGGGGAPDGGGVAPPPRWALPNPDGGTMVVEATRHVVGCVQAWVASAALVLDYGRSPEAVGWVAIELNAAGDPIVTFGGCVAAPCRRHPHELVLGYSRLQLAKLRAMAAH
jgi:hypothetical protein